MKNLKLRKGYALYILLALVLCVGCNQSAPKTIEEYSIVVKITQNNSDGGKYWIVTDDYNFFTNREFSIGDTVRLAN